MVFLSSLSLRKGSETLGNSPPPLPPFHPLPLPPSRFSLNIDPMDVHEVAMRLEVIQLDVSMQWKLQAEVASVQASFLYNDTLPQSALHQVR